MMDKRFGTTLVLILVIIFILIYAGSLTLVFLKVGIELPWTLFLAIFPLIIIVALISVYRERIKELDEEEKDDLKKY